MSNVYEKTKHHEKYVCNQKEFCTIIHTQREAGMKKSCNSLEFTVRNKIQ